MESVWRKQESESADETKRKRERSENSHWDVVVIGAGMAGLLTAYYLKEQGKSVLILEADRIASGQTEKTTAKITSQHGIKYSTLIKKIGMKKAWLYAQANEAAIEEYERLIQGQGIVCQFERVPAYLYTKQNADLLQEEVKAATALGIDAYFTKKTELPFPIAGAVCFRNQAQFSPLEFVKHISAKLEIWEQTEAIAIKGKKVFTKDDVVTAEKIVVATHYPIRNVPGFFFLRQHQERSYVLALSGCPEIKGMYYGIDESGLSFRQAGEFLLLGGSSHRTGENETGGSYELLRKKAKEYFSDCREEARWSAQDCMPHDGLPFIGKYSIFTPNLYVATGFQKWGMTTSMIAAKIIRDEICEIENPYARLFSPQRVYFRAGIKDFLIDICVSAKGLFKGWLGRTQAPEATPKVPVRCAHMGCELKWNPDEKSWDCPCHGSRFDAEGNVLDNPAKKGV